MKYEMVPASWLSAIDIEGYAFEFEGHGETCNVLWRQKLVGAVRFKDELDANGKSMITKEFYLGFLVDDVLAGMCRITPEPRHAANGNVGYGLSPDFRGKGHAPIMLRLIQDFCQRVGIAHPTAAVDIKNTRSINALRNAGWQLTGKRYLWSPDPNPRIAIEFELRR